MAFNSLEWNSARQRYFCSKFLKPAISKVMSSYVSLEAMDSLKDKDGYEGSNGVVKRLIFETSN